MQLWLPQDTRTHPRSLGGPTSSTRGIVPSPRRRRSHVWKRRGRESRFLEFVFLSQLLRIVKPPWQIGKILSFPAVRFVVRIRRWSRWYYCSDCICNRRIGRRIARDRGIRSDEGRGVYSTWPPTPNNCCRPQIWRLHRFIAESDGKEPANPHRNDDLLLHLLDIRQRAVSA